MNGNTVKQCLATGANTQITINVNGINKSTFKFNDSSRSPADVGYMYGARIESSELSNAASIVFTFSNDVSHSGNTYTLDTSAGQSITGTWADKREEAATRYHYFCIDGSTSCDNTKIGYIIYFGNSNLIPYLNISGHDNIEAAKTAMFTNSNDSEAKAMIETWFEQQNLDGHLADTRKYEDDLEDAIFCNDRSYYSGALKGKDSYNGGTNAYSYYAAWARTHIKNAQNNYEPSLDCTNKNDAFTKNDTTNGNGKLDHSIGLIAVDELTMAGSGRSGYDSTAYLYTGQVTWSASPEEYDILYAHESTWNLGLGNYGVSNPFGLRPLVSLKAGTSFASGTGLKTDPYIIP